jgi:mediator of RNA polymerase II transcription subunit 13, fungi type
MPLSTMSLSSPALRQVFSAIKKAVKTYSEARIQFQLIPEQSLHGNYSNPTAAFSDAETMCFLLYNRILVPVDRTMSRRFYDHGERVRRYFQEPITMLARERYTKTEMQFKSKKAVTLDVLDNDTFLHVGYIVSKCQNWVLAVCTDQRGEGYELGVWFVGGQTESGDNEELTDEETPEDHSGVAPENIVPKCNTSYAAVKKVWGLLEAFAKRANVQWRIAISRLGAMPESELSGIFPGCPVSYGF